MLEARAAPACAGGTGAAPAGRPGGNHGVNSIGCSACDNVAGAAPSRSLPDGGDAQSSAPQRQ